jgi:hypothetical protein
MRGTQRFKVKGKLAPRYAGPFQIIDHKGEVTYQLELPPQLPDVHDVFHISEEQIPMEQPDLGGDLSYSERSIRILDTTEQVTHSKVTKMCKV